MTAGSHPGGVEVIVCPHRVGGAGEGLEIAEEVADLEEIGHVTEVAGEVGQVIVVGADPGADGMGTKMRINLKGVCRRG